MDPTSVDDVDALLEKTGQLSKALAATQSALSAAEARERLRVADDLHDIIGHALEVIAFKAELADRQLGARPERVRDALIEIQGTARSAITDLRGLALRRRSTDLGHELTHAIALFTTAGIEVRVFGDPDDITDTARDPLARALREATTNIIRHATPTRCIIRLEQSCDAALIEVENNGVMKTHLAPDVLGVGITGLRRLFAEQNGHVEARPAAPRSFRFRAYLYTFSPQTATPSRRNKHQVDIVGQTNPLASA